MNLKGHCENLENYNAKIRKASCKEKAKKNYIDKKINAKFYAKE